MKKIGLLPKLILAIVIGIGIGMLGMEVPVKLLATFNGIFGNFLKFSIPLIIIGFVAPGIGDLGIGAGKLLGITTGIAYLSTVAAGTFTYFVNTAVFKKILKVGSMAMDAGGSGNSLLDGYITINMPPIMDVMTALLMAFLLGTGIAVAKGTAIKNVMGEFQGIVEGLIRNIIIPFLPLHIAGIFANMTYAGQVATILAVFSKVFAVIICLHIAVLAVQYIIAGMITGSNPVTLIKTMLPAYFTAIGTQSSAAAIPVTLNQTKENGVNTGIAEFVVPLCSTIHLSGSTITLVSCAMAIMMLNGMTVSFGTMFGFIMMLGVTMVAAPGVPGGAVMAALGIIETMLGFPPTLTSLMIALYLAQDSFGTACNVTGDGAIAIMVNRVAGFKLEKNPKEIFDNI